MDSYLFQTIHTLEGRSNMLLEVTQQVLVLANSGTRALSSVLQNVIDAWRRSAHLTMPELGLA